MDLTIWYLPELWISFTSFFFFGRLSDKKRRVTVRAVHAVSP